MSQYSPKTQISQDFIRSTDYQMRPKKVNWLDGSMKILFFFKESVYKMETGGWGGEN